MGGYARGPRWGSARMRRSTRFGVGLAFGFAATSSLLLHAQGSTNELASALESEDDRPRLRNVTV